MRTNRAGASTAAPTPEPGRPSFRALRVMTRLGQARERAWPLRIGACLRRTFGPARLDGAGGCVCRRGLRSGLCSHQALAASAGRCVDSWTLIFQVAIALGGAPRFAGPRWPAGRRSPGSAPRAVCPRPRGPLPTSRPVRAGSGPTKPRAVRSAARGPRLRDVIEPGRRCARRGA